MGGRSFFASVARWALPGIVLATPTAAFAGSLTVAPTTIELESSHDIGVLYVTNESGAPLIAQIEPFDWSQAEGKERLAPSTALIVSPPMARVAQGAQQVIRLQAAGATGPQEHTYRLLVTQLADPAAPKKPGINLLLQFSVPVFVHPAVPSRKPDVAFDAVLSGNAIAVTARNLGREHIKFANIEVLSGSARTSKLAESGLFYVLAGAEHQWLFADRSAVDGETVRIEAHDAAGGPPLVTDVVLHRAASPSG